MGIGITAPPHHRDEGLTLGSQTALARLAARQDLLTFNIGGATPDEDLLQCPIAALAEVIVIQSAMPNAGRLNTNRVIVFRHP